MVFTLQKTFNFRRQKKKDLEGILYKSESWNARQISNDAITRIHPAKDAHTFLSQRLKRFANSTFFLSTFDPSRTNKKRCDNTNTSS